MGDTVHWGKVLCYIAGLAAPLTRINQIGAGIDSFFEYAFKSHILLSGLPYDPNHADLHSPDAFLSAWEDAHAGIKRHIYRGSAYQHPHYIQVDLYTGPREPSG
jgi:hypothetical protein